MLTRFLPRRPQVIVPGERNQRGLRRIDFYIGIVVIVLAVFASAYSQRYSVTRTDNGRLAVFQRTDHWTGRAEVWVYDGTAQTQPEWVRIASQQ